MNRRSESATTHSDSPNRKMKCELGHEQRDCEGTDRRPRHALQSWKGGDTNCEDAHPDALGQRYYPWTTPLQQATDRTLQCVVGDCPKRKYPSDRHSAIE